MQRLIAERFVELMAWLEQTQRVARHPSLMAAALQLAAEACKVCFQFLATLPAVCKCDIACKPLLSLNDIPWLGHLAGRTM